MTLTAADNAATPLDETCINTIRFLAVDTIQQASSSHPGLHLGAAPMAYNLWDRFLRHNPACPPGPLVMEDCGFTAGNLCNRALLLGKG